MIRLNKSALASILAFLFAALVRSIRCQAVNAIVGEELIALTRDHRERQDPDELLNGFIPVWAIVIYVLSGIFFVLSVLSGACYLFGCKNPNKKAFKAIN